MDSSSGSGTRGLESTFGGGLAGLLRKK